MEPIRDFPVKYCNCIEGALCRILLNCDMDCSMIFFKCWALNYGAKDTKATPTYNVYSNDFHELYYCLDKYYGMQPIIIPDISLNQKELFDLKASYRFILLTLSPNDCYWLPVVPVERRPHVVIIKDFDEHGIYCIDNRGTNYLQYHSIHDIESCNLKVIQSNKQPLEDKYYLSELLNTLNNLLTHKEPFNAMMHLAKDTLDDDSIKTNLLETPSEYLFVSPVIDLITDIGFSKYNFCKILNEQVIEDPLLLANIRNEFQVLASEWLSINKLITKYYFSHDKDILIRVSDKIKDLSIKEERTATDLHSSIVRLGSKDYV